MVQIQCLSGVARQVFGRDPSILEESAGRGLIQCNNNINDNNNNSNENDLYVSLLQFIYKSVPAHR